MPDLSYLGKMIYEARTKANITSSKLCYGLCSVSMLSRIESGERTPGFLLFRSLLQRAGGTNEDIIYLCSKRECKLYSIICDSSSFSSNPGDTLARYSAVVDLSNKLEAQYYYFFKAQAETNIHKKYEFIKEALNCTLPNTDIEDVSSYYLSTIENTIVTYALSYLISLKQIRTAAKVYGDLAYFHEKDPSDTTRIKSSFADRYGMLICSLVDGDIEEVHHLGKRFFKKYDAATYPDIESVVAKYSYQYGYSSVYLDSTASGIDIITAYYMNLLMGDAPKAELILKDAQNDLGYEFEIEFTNL